MLSFALALETRHDSERSLDPLLWLTLQVGWVHGGANWHGGKLSSEPSRAPDRDVHVVIF